MEKQDETKSSHRRRSRRVQQLVGEHAVRRSPRLSRQGMPPSYSLNRSNKRSSRESSVASSISLRSSRASEFLNESGQTLFEESERFDETLLRQASDEPQSSFTREDSRFIRSGIVPSLTESEGAVTLSDGKQQDVSGSDLPIHLYGLDDDGELELSATAYHSSHSCVCLSLQMLRLSSTLSTSVQRNAFCPPLPLLPGLHSAQMSLGD